jgi:hypothetical protein
MLRSSHRLIRTPNRNLRIGKRPEFAISDQPPVGSTSCQSSIATPFGNDGGQACDFSVSHVTIGGHARVFLVSMPGYVAQRDETDQTTLLVSTGKRRTFFSRMIVSAAERSSSAKELKSCLDITVETLIPFIGAA